MTGVYQGVIKIDLRFFIIPKEMSKEIYATETYFQGLSVDKVGVSKKTSGDKHDKGDGETCAP